MRDQGDAQPGGDGQAPEVGTEVTRRRWPVYLAIAVALAVAAAIVLPQYGEHAVRASVAEGIAKLQPYRDQVAAALQQKIPPPAPDPRQFYKSVRAVQVAGNGELRITFQGHRTIDGRSIVQVPMVGGGMVHAWACYNIDMPERELSVACREKRR
jgi:hypothetical protein